MSFLIPPWQLLRCSWPRPVQSAAGRWSSEPDWDAPPLPKLPQAGSIVRDGEGCWQVDWREFFRSGLQSLVAGAGGEMRGFHLVFEIRIHATGTLLFWDGDGSIIRREGQVVHVNRSAHAAQPSRLAVRAGERLQVAQWHEDGAWSWAARVDRSEPSDRLLAYRDSVARRLKRPDGPSLKMFISGRAPNLTALAFYSLVLNGYAPAGLQLFGDHQWPESSRRLFAELLPFAEVVPTAALVDRTQSHGGPQLVEWALANWPIMKACATLFWPPHEFCLMDDDVLILDRPDDALSAFQRADVVFSQDTDYSEPYVAVWGWLHNRKPPLPTGTLNAGLLWLRHQRDPRRLARQMLRVPTRGLTTWVWEQGFLASEFVNDRVVALPTQRYLFPAFDGLPGGVLGYDYAANPCGFVSIHLGGLKQKPDDALALALAGEVLDRNTGSRHRQTN